MIIPDALHALGVREDTLSQQEKAHLDREGFLPLYNILTLQQAEQMGARLDELIAIEGEDDGKEVQQEAGTDFLADLINKGEIFEVCFTHPRVLAAVAHVLKGEFKLSSLNSRTALPGRGLQHIHADWDEPVDPNEFLVCNSIWLIDEFTPNNGATRIVPGSHLSRKLPRDEMPDLAAPHPDEIKLVAPPGTVIVFNAHAWHGGTLNSTRHRRRAMHSYFCRRDEVQQLDQRKYIRPTTYSRLSEAARYLLDVE